MQWQTEELVLTKLHRHALVSPFVSPPSPSLLFASALYLFFFFSKHTLTFSSPNSLDASGSVSPGEMCHLLSDIPAIPSRTNLCSIKMDQDQGFFFLPELSICIIIFDTADRGEFMENQRAGFSLSPLCSAPRLVYLDQYCCLLVISFPTSIIHLSTVLTKTP